MNGDDNFYKEILDQYEHSYYGYGIHILRKICENYGWDSKKLGDQGGVPEEGY